MSGLLVYQPSQLGDIFYDAPDNGSDPGTGSAASSTGAAASPPKIEHGTSTTSSRAPPVKPKPSNLSVHSSSGDTWSYVLREELVAVAKRLTNIRQDEIRYVNDHIVEISINVKDTSRYTSLKDDLFEGAVFHSTVQGSTVYAFWKKGLDDAEAKWGGLSVFRPFLGDAVTGSFGSLKDVYSYEIRKDNSGKFVGGSVKILNEKLVHDDNLRKNIVRLLLMYSTGKYQPSELYSEIYKDIPTELYAIELRLRMLEGFQNHCPKDATSPIDDDFKKVFTTPWPKVKLMKDRISLPARMDGRGVSKFLCLSEDNKNIKEVMGTLVSTKGFRMKPDDHGTYLRVVHPTKNNTLRYLVLWYGGSDDKDVNMPSVDHLNKYFRVTLVEYLAVRASSRTVIEFFGHDNTASRDYWDVMKEMIDLKVAQGALSRSSEFFRNGKFDPVPTDVVDPKRGWNPSLYNLCASLSISLREPVSGIAIHDEIKTLLRFVPRHEDRVEDTIYRRMLYGICLASQENFCDPVDLSDGDGVSDDDIIMKFCQIARLLIAKKDFSLKHRAFLACLTSCIITSGNSSEDFTENVLSGIITAKKDLPAEFGENPKNSEGKFVKNMFLEREAFKTAIKHGTAITDAFSELHDIIHGQKTIDQLAAFAARSQRASLPKYSQAFNEALDSFKSGGSLYDQLYSTRKSTSASMFLMILHSVNPSEDLLKLFRYITPDLLGKLAHTILENTP